MSKLPTIYLDMDGTIADLYSVNNWLTMLQEEKTTPYRNARLLLDNEQITFLQDYIKQGGSVGIISWTARNGTPKYNNQVRSAKVSWLKRNLPLEYSEIHIVKYGTRKSKFGKVGDILIDDEQGNRTDYITNGMKAYHPNEWHKMMEKFEKKIEAREE